MRKKPDMRFSALVVVAAMFFSFGWYGANRYGIEKNVSGRPSGTKVIDSADNAADRSGMKDVEDIDLELLYNVWKNLRQNYVDESIFDDKKQVYGAIIGLVDSINDPYTSFMTPSQSKEFQDGLNGKLEGIGAELTVIDQKLVVVTPLKGSPAERAGVRPGDVIYKINDEFAGEMTLLEAVMKIRGERGTTVSLTIFRADNPDPVELEMIRDSIAVESVSWEEKEKGIAYIGINKFGDNTSNEFQKAVGEILLMQPKGIILDIRNNGGGYLDISVDILGELLRGKKEVVTIKERNPEENQTFMSSGNARLADIPLVVLANFGSASASEIVAGAIQDYKRGPVIGEQTFGKGSVQEVDTLADGSSLRITIAKWFTPTGRSIDKVGITPDRVVEFTEEDYENDLDPQMAAALEYLE